MAWTQHIDWTPDEEQALDDIMVELGHARREDLEAARAIPLSTGDADAEINDDDDDSTEP